MIRGVVISSSLENRTGEKTVERERGMPRGSPLSHLNPKQNLQSEQVSSLEIPLDCQEIKPVHPKGDQS